MGQSVWRSILFGFITGILFSGCATLTPETASIMTPHELCLKYTGNNKDNARTAQLRILMLMWFKKKITTDQLAMTFVRNTVPQLVSMIIDDLKQLLSDHPYLDSKYEEIEWGCLILSLVLLEIKVEASEVSSDKKDEIIALFRDMMLASFGNQTDGIRYVRDIKNYEVKIKKDFEFISLIDRIKYSSRKSESDGFTSVEEVLEWPEASSCMEILFQLVLGEIVQDNEKLSSALSKSDPKGVRKMLLEFCVSMTRSIGGIAEEYFHRYKIV